MKTEYEDFNFLKEKLTLLMSKYCIYTFRVKNNRFSEDKETINNYKIFLDYINRILDVMDSSNAEIIKKLFIMKNNWTTLGYSRSSFYDHRRKAVYNFFNFTRTDMIVCNTNTPYYLRELEKNPVNNNHYVYFSGCEGDIRIYENQWYFNLNFYINHNLNLPTNVFLINYDTPFAQLTDLTLNIKWTSEFPDFVIDPNSCTLYNVQFNIDTSNSEYFNNKFINYQFNLNTLFKVDEEVINTANLDNNPSDVNKFMSEFNAMNSFNHIKYTNYFNSDNEGNFKVVDQYHIKNDTWSETHNNVIKYVMNNHCVNLQKPINNLCSINMEDNFIIMGYNIAFNYSIDNSEIKTLSTTNSDPIYCNQNYILDYPFATYYDESKKEVINIVSDNNGFYIPVDCAGYYTITLQILTSSKFIIMKLTQPFNFISDPTHGDYFFCEEYWINDLTNFTTYEV